MLYREIEGNLITLAQEGKFDVVAHGCNCFSTMGAGIAPQMAQAFGCDQYPMEISTKYVGHEILKLGNIDYEDLQFLFGKNLYVVNAYTQYGFGRNHPGGSVAPLDYEALEMCFRKINKIFAGKHLGIPQIGCGLAGGDWKTVRNLIFECFDNLSKVTVVFYKPEKANEQKQETTQTGV